MDPLAREDIRVNIRLIEHLAAFTVLGYIAAEWRGRAELSWGRDFPQLLLVGIVSALVLEISSRVSSRAGRQLPAAHDRYLWRTVRGYPLPSSAGSCPLPAGSSNPAPVAVPGDGIRQ